MGCMWASAACQIVATPTGTSSALTVRDLTVAVAPQSSVDGRLLSRQHVPVTFRLQTRPRHGSVELIDPHSGAFRYTSHDGDIGFERFTYVANRVDTGDISNVGTVDIAITDGGIAGHLSYDRVPAHCDAHHCGLDHASVMAQPAANIIVALLDATDVRRVLAQTTADADGRYLFATAPAAPYLVAALAQMDWPPIAVMDNTQGGAVYAMVSEPVTQTGRTGTVMNLHADSGWDGTAYRAPRVAAPFAILDTMYTAARQCTTVRPGLVLAPLPVYWSAVNAPESGDPNAGLITSTHWTGHAMYVLGDADVDTDEYDSHVLAHEFAHYLESTQARSDSLGGPHGPGDLLDARVAFSEGFADAFSAMALYPDTLYIDTSGPAQAEGMAFDLADMGSVDTHPGWYSEASVGAILFDLFAPPRGAQPDRLRLDLGGVLDILTGPHRDARAATSIFTYLAGAKATLPDMAEGVDALGAARGIDPVVDEWGSGQRADGGVAAALPIYASTAANDMGQGVTLAFSTPSAGATQALFNKLAENRLVHFVGDGQPITISADCQVPTAVMVSSGPIAGLFSGGELEAAPAACLDVADCRQTLSHVATVAGMDYTISLQDRDGIAEDGTCFVSLSH